MTIATVDRVPCQVGSERVGWMVRGFSLSSPLAQPPGDQHNIR
jgi:hypothetical protein